MKVLKVSMGIVVTALLLYGMTPFIQGRAWSYCIYVPPVPISHGDYFSNARDDCFSQQIGTRQEQSLCLYSSVSSREKEDGIFNHCIESFARSTGDNSMCHLLTNYGSQRDHCYKGAAITLEDPKKCGLVEAWTIRDVCLNDIAVKVSDDSVCADISNDYTRSDCVSVVNGGEPAPEPTATIEIADGKVVCTDLRDFSRGTVGWQYVRMDEVGTRKMVLGTDGKYSSLTFSPPYTDWKYVYLYWEAGPKGHKISNTIENPLLHSE